MDIAMIKQSVILSGMADSEIDRCLTALNATEKEYARDELILTAGDMTDRFGLVLDGSVTIESNDIWGNRTILSHVDKMQFFAETYALLENATLLVDVRANENCRILFFSIGSLKNMRLFHESWTVKFISNMLTVSAQKNLILSGRSFHTSPKTIRERVLSYLNTVSLQKHSAEFEIPFDRQQLADYLNVDRSALSNELSKLQREGILQCRKSHFKVISD